MRQHTQEEKQAIIDCYLNRESVASIVSDSGIPRSTIYAWIKQFKEENSKTKKGISLRYVHDLERKVTRLEGIVEIIHKAHCFESSARNLL